MSVLLSLKIGARTYEVTEQTRFFCNAATVQMLDTGLKQPPVLRAKHIKRQVVTDKYNGNLFLLKIFQK